VRAYLHNSILKNERKLPGLRRLLKHENVVSTKQLAHAYHFITRSNMFCEVIFFFKSYFRRNDDTDHCLPTLNESFKFIDNEDNLNFVQNLKGFLADIIQ